MLTFGCPGDEESNTELAITEVHHLNEAPTLVNGYQDPGSYVRPIEYNDMYREQFDELIKRATSCEQYIKYKCYTSRLLASAGACGCYSRACRAQLFTISQ